MSGLASSFMNGSADSDDTMEEIDEENQEIEPAEAGEDGGPDPKRAKVTEKAAISKRHDGLSDAGSANAASMAWKSKEKTTKDAYDKAAPIFLKFIHAHASHMDEDQRTIIYDFNGKKVFASQWNWNIFLNSKHADCLMKKPRSGGGIRGYRGSTYAGVGPNTLDTQWAAAVMLADIERAYPEYRQRFLDNNLLIIATTPQEITDVNGKKCVLLVRANRALPNTMLTDAKKVIGKQIRQALTELPSGFQEAITYTQMMTLGNTAISMFNVESGVQ